MKKKIKKIFSKIIDSKRATRFLIFAVSIFIVSIPSKFVNAAGIPGPWDLLGWGMDKVLGISMSGTTASWLLLGSAILGVVASLASFAAAILSWIVHLNIFLTRCDTAIVQTTGNDCIVHLGWEFSRNLANALFVVALVVIALLYILKLDTWGLKKSLPMLLFVAVIINFSGVFVGVIVDVAQILMNTFLRIINWGSITNQLQKNIIFNWHTFASFFSAEEAAKTEIKIIVMIIFYAYLMLILASYAILFIVRMIALWILTMIAPLAFFSLILPFTKGWFGKWLNWVLSWAFMGVIALFFLTFGFYLLGTIGDAGLKLPSVGMSMIKNPFGITDYFQSIFPYIIVLFFLHIGFKTAKSTAPAAAKAVMAGFEKAAGYIVKAAGIAATAGVGMAAVGAAGAVGVGTRASLQAAATRSAGKGPIAAVGGFLRKRAAGTMLEVVEDVEKKSFSEEYARAQKRTIDDQARSGAAGLRNKNQDAAIIKAASEKGQLRDLMELHPNEWDSRRVISAFDYFATREDKEGMSALNEKIGNLPINPGDPNSPTFSKKFAEIRDRVTGEKVARGTLLSKHKTTNGVTDDETTEEIVNDVKYKRKLTYVEKIMKDTKNPSELGKEWLKSPEAIEAMNKFWGGSQVAEAGKTFGAEYVQKMQEFSDSHGADWYIKNNKALMRYLSSSTAAGLGFKPVKGADTIDKIRTLEEEHDISMMPIGTLEEQNLKKQAEVKMFRRQLETLQGISARTPAQNTEIEALRQKINNRKISLAGPGVAGMSAEIDAMTEELRELKNARGRTPAQNARIQSLENEITRRNIALGPADEPVIEQIKSLEKDIVKIDEKAGIIKRSLTANELKEKATIERKIEVLRRSLGKKP